MKKAIIFTLLAFVLGFSGWSQEAKAQEGDKVTVFQCPMGDYIISAKCPHCGMNMEQKEMTAHDAQAAMDAAKRKMKNL